MPYIINKYRCSYCHKEFNSFSEAFDHEKKCHKCNTCTNAYYVYGCDIECDYKKKCFPPKYKCYVEIESE